MPWGVGLGELELARALPSLPQDKQGGHASAMESRFCGFLLALDLYFICILFVFVCLSCVGYFADGCFLAVVFVSKNTTKIQICVFRSAITAIITTASVFVLYFHRKT